MRVFARSTAIAVLLLVGTIPGLSAIVAAPRAQAEEDSTARPSTPLDPVAELARLRDELVQLRFETVLADSDRLLRETGLTPDVEVELWILRSQAHVAMGDLDAAEDDFRAILERRPGYRPESTLMTPAATRRFEAVRSATVGVLRLEVAPADATVVLEDTGRVADPGSDGRVPVVAGSRQVRIERPGYDAWTETVAVEPGAEVYLQVQLVPNARTVIFRTTEPDVEIRIDGVEVGRTRFPEAIAPGARPVASLTVPNIPLGEHAFAFDKACFRTERVTEMLNIDILDPRPLVLPLTTMEPARAPLAVEGRPRGAEVRVDGDGIGTVPVADVPICPGTRVVEVVLDERRLYRAEIDVRDGVPVRLDVAPRPNVALLGVDGWPAGFEAAHRWTNVVERRDLPASFDRDRPVRSVEGSLPDDVHLVFAALPAGGGGAGAFVLGSPILGTTVRLDAPPVDVEPPAWTVATTGATLADTRIAGPARVVAVRRGGPAERAGLRVGDRVLEVDGAAIASADDFRARVAAASPGATLGLRVRGADGAVRELPLVTGVSPRIQAPPDREGAAEFRAAWARQEARARPGDAAAELAGLADLLERAGRAEAALATWNQVRWEDRTGIGAGTVAYRRGRLLRVLGREDDAVDAFRVAASSRSSERDDDGPVVAPAAVDHLADLGVAVDGATTR